MEISLAQLEHVRNSEEDDDILEVPPPAVVKFKHAREDALDIRNHKRTKLAPVQASKPLVSKKSNINPLKDADKIKPQPSSSRLTAHAKKPFKTPFKATDDTFLETEGRTSPLHNIWDLKIQENELIVISDDNEDDNTENNAMSDGKSRSGDLEQHVIHPSSVSDVFLASPVTDIEVEASFSLKVPVSFSNICGRTGVSMGKFRSIYGKGP